MQIAKPSVQKPPWFTGKVKMRIRSVWGCGCLRGERCAGMHMYVYLTYKIKENFDRMQHRLDVWVCRKLLKDVKCTTEKPVCPRAQGHEKCFLQCLPPFLNVRKKRKPGNDTDPLLMHTIIFWNNHAKASINISEAFEEKWSDVLESHTHTPHEYASIVIKLSN